MHSTKINVIKEKRSSTTNSINNVKWRDNFEHYDNDSKLFFFIYALVLENSTYTDQELSVHANLNKRSL